MFISGAKIGIISETSKKKARNCDAADFLGNESRNYLVVRGKMPTFASQWIQNEKTHRSWNSV